MKKQISFSILLVIFIFSAVLNLRTMETAHAAGNYFYVDFNYVGPESGLSAQPFNTMTEAVSEAACGDHIYLKEGTYRIPSSRIKDMEVRNFRPDNLRKDSATSDMLRITVDPASTGKVVLAAEGAFGNSSFFRIINSQCVLFDGADRLIIDGSAATFNNNASLIILYAFQKQIENIIVENMEVRNTSGRGISFLQKADALPGNIIIRNNKIHHIGQRAVGGYGNTVFIEGNEIHDAAMSNQNQSYGSSGWPGVVQTARGYDGAADLYYYCKNIFIRKNNIHDCWGEGIIVWATLGGEISQNSIHDVFSVYIYVGASKDIVINRNHLYRTTPVYDRNDKSPPEANGISFASESHPWGVGQEPVMIENMTLCNNLLDNMGKGISFWHDMENRSSTNSYGNLSILHNVLRNLHNVPFQMDAVPTGFIVPANGRIQNNIIENKGTSITETCAMGNADTWVFSNNNWTGGLPVMGDHPGSRAGSSGFTGLNINAGALPENFRLKKGSDNISAGTETEILEDFWGTTRNGKHPSIGIHEYDTTIETPADIQVKKIP